jgi:hypothetical protein
LRNDVQQQSLAEQRGAEEQLRGGRPALQGEASSPRDRLARRAASEVEVQLVLRQLQDLRAFVAGEPELQAAVAGAGGEDALLAWVLDATDVMALKSPVATLELLEWVGALARAAAAAGRLLRALPLAPPLPFHAPRPPPPLPRRRCPRLCALPLPTMTLRVLQLKLLLPQADVSEIVRHKPSLLLLEVGPHAAPEGHPGGGCPCPSNLEAGAAVAPRPGAAAGCRRTGRLGPAARALAPATRPPCAAPRRLQDLPSTLGAALSKLRALMPGIPVEARLHEGSTVWWSFVSLL